MRAIWFGVALALAACGGTPSTTQPRPPQPAPAAPPPAAPPPAASRASAVARLQGFSDAMCKCPDKTCADQIVAEMTRWGQEQAQQAGSDQPLSPEDAKQVASIAEVMTGCMIKLSAPPP